MQSLDYCSVTWPNEFFRSDLLDSMSSSRVTQEISRFRYPSRGCRGWKPLLSFSTATVFVVGIAAAVVVVRSEGSTTARAPPRRRRRHRAGGNRPAASSSLADAPSRRARAPSLPCLSRSPYAPCRSAYFCVKSVFMTGQRLGEISVAEKAARAALHCIPFGGSKVTSWLTTSERDRKEQCFRKSFCSRLVAHPLTDKKIADSAVSGGGARMKIFVGVSERKLYFL